MVKGLKNAVKSIEVVGSGYKVGHKVVGKISWSEVPGLIYIDALPEKERDKDMTVLKLTLDGPVKLYRGKGGFH
jgi:alpha-L-fucosidase